LTERVASSTRLNTSFGRLSSGFTPPAAAAILGMIPIMHDVFWGPMAYAIVGGLAVATALTLVFLPALYVAVNGTREKEEPAAAPDPAAEHSLAPQA